MLQQPQRISSFSGQMFPMRSAKLKHQNKVCVSALIVPSMIGGSTIRVENLSNQATKSLSSGPCKATLNNLTYGKNMPMQS